MKKNTPAKRKRSRGTTELKEKTGPIQKRRKIDHEVEKKQMIPPPPPKQAPKQAILSNQQPSRKVEMVDEDEDKPYDRAAALKKFIKENVEGKVFEREVSLHENDKHGWEAWLKKYNESERILFSGKRKQVK